MQMSTENRAQGKPVLFHPLAHIFPLMEGEEFNELVVDIKKHGQREPIVLYEDKILDGRNRYRACLEAGIQAVAVERDDQIDDPVSYVISANVHRRHLTAEQKRDLIAKLLVAQPEKSDRQIAKLAKVDHHKVGKVRKEEEDVGKIPHVAQRTDTKGRKQPSHKPPVAPDAAERTNGSGLISPTTMPLQGRAALQVIAGAKPVHRPEILNGHNSAELLDGGLIPPKRSSELLIAIENALEILGCDRFAQQHPAIAKDVKVDLTRARDRVRAAG